MSTMGTAGTAVADPKNGNGGHAGKGRKIDAETYVETGDYLYRRVRTAESDSLVRIEIESGEVTFAEVASKSNGKYIQTDNIGGLKSQTKAAVSDSVESESHSAAEDKPHPSQVVAGTNGVSAQDEGVIFERIDVEEEYLGGCGNVLYNGHRYFHISMELQDYGFDDLGDVVALGVVCDAVFQLVGKKSKTLKTILQKVRDTRFIRAIPDSICGFIFGTILDGIFSNGTGTFALWNYDTEDWWGTTPKLAFGGDSEYDPAPSDVINNGAKRYIPTAYTSKFT